MEFDIAGGMGSVGMGSGHMNDVEKPVLIFEQHGKNREIIHNDFYQLLLREAGS
jgi:hypothetical protein